MRCGRSTRLHCSEEGGRTGGIELEKADRSDPGGQPADRRGRAADEGEGGPDRAAAAAAPRARGANSGENREI